jgi:hypothetical protein
MVQDLKNAFGELIDEAEWMDDGANASITIFPFQFTFWGSIFGGGALWVGMFAGAQRTEQFIIIISETRKVAKDKLSAVTVLLGYKKPGDFDAATIEAVYVGLEPMSEKFYLRNVLRLQGYNFVK